MGLDPDRTRTGVTSAEQRLPIMDHGSRIMDHGSRIMDQGSWIKDQRSSIKDQKSTIKYQGSWIKYQGSRTLDLGPCLGTNDNSRWDPDMISRLPDTTTQDL